MIVHHPLYDPEKAALAFDVMMRRNADFLPILGIIFGSSLKTHEQRCRFMEWVVFCEPTDLFTAIVESEAWIKANVEAK